MKQFFMLTGVFFKSSLDVNKKNGSFKKALVFLIGLALFLIILSIGLTHVYFKINAVNPKSYLVLLGLIFSASILTLVASFFQMGTSLFRCKDYAFFASLPIKNSKIIGAKLCSIYLFHLLIDFCIIFPCSIIYSIKCSNYIGILIGLVSGIFASLIPLLISTLIGIIVSLITVKSKHSNTLSVVIYAIFFIGISLGAVFLLNGEHLFDNFTIVIPYLKFLESALAKQNYLGILYYLLINIGALGLIILVSGILYSPLNQLKQENGSGKYISKGDGNEIRKNISLKKVLFFKEINLVLRNPTFILSTYITPILYLLVGVISFGVIGKGFTSHTADDIRKAQNTLILLEPIIGALLASFSSTTYASFSMEGKNISMLMTYPISTKDVIDAKIKASAIPLSILFGLSSTIICLVICGCQGFSNFKYYHYLNTILFPVGAVICTTFVSAFCGLKWIKTDFVDPNDILKKGKAMGFAFLFSSLFNIGAMIALFFVRGLTAKEGTSEIFNIFPITISLVYFAIIAIIFAVLVDNKGVKYFERAAIN